MRYRSHYSLCAVLHVGIDDDEGDDVGCDDNLIEMRLGWSIVGLLLIEDVSPLWRCWYMYVGM